MDSISTLGLSINDKHSRRVTGALLVTIFITDVESVF